MRHANVTLHDSVGTPLGTVQALVGHPDWLGWAVSGGLALVVIGALAAGRARTRRRAAARAAARRTESEIVKV